MTGALPSRIRPLHTGHYTMPPSDTRFPNDRIIVRAFLIEHPHGLFLMDTGFSPTDRRALEAFAPVHIRPIRSVLAEQDVPADDVRMIANCHFHSDHSGGNHEFPGIPIFVQRAEVAHLRATHVARGDGAAPRHRDQAFSAVPVNRAP